MSRPPSPEVVVVGRPELVLSDGERACLAELIASLLLEALDAGDEAVR